MQAVKEVMKFVEQVKSEAGKISWPNRNELTTSVMVVVSSVFVASMFFLLADYTIHSLIQYILNIGK